MPDVRANFAEGHPCAALTEYCFGELSESARDTLEQHLLLCDHCWDEFRRLDGAVRALRTATSINSVVGAADVVAVLGLSGRLGRPFAGHARFAASVALLFGSEWALGLWSELGYAYDRYGSLARVLSAPVFVWVAITLLLALGVSVRAARTARTDGALRALMTALAGTIVLTGLLMWLLPGDPTIEASFQTRSAAVGYFKDALLIFTPLLLFLVPSFDSVVRLQAELHAGQYAGVLTVIAGTNSPPSRGLWYVSPRLMLGALVLGAVVKIGGTNHMLDALRQGPYANLFAMTAYVSTGLWVAIALTCVIWFQSSLRELTREAKALHAVHSQRSKTD